MNYATMIVAFFFLTRGQTDPVQIPSIVISGCEHMYICKYQNNEISYGERLNLAGDSLKILMSEKVDRSDSLQLANIISTLTKKKGDEFLWNSCVNDGFHFKVYIRANGIKKKILIGNYYDERIDQLTAIFNKYLKWNGLHVGYGMDRQNINELIKWQKSCTMKVSGKRLMDEWYELPEKQKWN